MSEQVTDYLDEIKDKRRKVYRSRFAFWSGVSLLVVLVIVGILILTFSEGRSWQAFVAYFSSGLCALWLGFTIRPKLERLREAESEYQGVQFGLLGYLTATDWIGGWTDDYDN